MPAKTAVIQKRDLEEMDIASISSILESSIDSLSDDTRKRVREFLDFLSDPWKDRFVLKCWEIKKVKDEIDDWDLYNLLSDARYNFQGIVFHTVNTKWFHVVVSKFKNGKLEFQDVVDRATVLTEIKYWDVIEVLYNTRNRDWIYFTWIQSLLSKLPAPDKATSQRIIWTKELDIIIWIAVNDRKCWDQSQYCLKLAEIFRITPDDRMMKKIELLKKRSQ